MQAEKQFATVLAAARAAIWVTAAVTAFVAFVALLQDAPTVVAWLVVREEACFA